MRLLIVYASQTETGRIRRLVDALREGAAGEPDTDIEVRRADQAGPEELLACQGLLLATPEHFGYMAGKLKDFFDRTFYPVEGRTVGLPYALIVSAGNDGRGTVEAVERIIEGYRWKAILPATVIRSDPTEEDLSRAREIGLTLAAGLSVGAF